MPHLPETLFKGLFAQNNKQFEKYVVTCPVEVKIEDDVLKKKKGLSDPGSQLHVIAKYTEEAKQWF